VVDIVKCFNSILPALNSKIKHELFQGSRQLSCVGTMMRENMESTPPPSASRTRHLQPEFGGSATEYFKIWIVNTLLTIVTLGFYIPWAKVRTRRYFYLNTSLDDEPFDYLADPKKLFYGYLIVGLFLIGYNYLPTINPLFAISFLIVGMIGLPWVIYKSRRFFCRNSAYRNISFRFVGDLGESYGAYLGYPILAVITGGIMLPYAIFKQKKFFFSNVAFGNIRSDFTGRLGYFFKVYLIAGACVSGIFFLVIGARAGSSASAPIALITIFVFYGVTFLALTFTNVLITNHCWNHTRFPGNMNFACNIDPWRLSWIHLSNAFLSVLSLGLLMPWAKVRVYHYRMACLHAHVSSDLSEVVSVIQNSDDGATGDMAVDHFDFEIGL